MIFLYFQKTQFTTEENLLMNVADLIDQSRLTRMRTPKVDIISTLIQSPWIYVCNLIKERITSMFTEAPWKVKVPHSETSWSDFCLNMTRSFFYWSNFFLLHILILIQTDFSRCTFFSLIFFFNVPSSDQSAYFENHWPQ